jgi:hypothetical protein
MIGAGTGSGTSCMEGVDAGVLGEELSMLGARSDGIRVDEGLDTWMTPSSSTMRVCDGERGELIDGFEFPDMPYLWSGQLSS